MRGFLDATEQEIPRLKNKRRRKSYYSGKKKNGQNTDNNEQGWIDHPYYGSCTWKEARLRPLQR